MKVLQTAAFAAALAFVAAPLARAQQPTTVVWQALIIQEDTTHRRDFAMWLSAGLGGGDNGVAGALHENVSIGPVLLMARQSYVGPFLGSGDAVDDKSVLVGLRSGGHRIFAAGALGYSWATPSHQCDCSSPITGSTTSALAYDFSVHANALVPGLVISLSGTAGHTKVTTSMVTVGVELGWFGH